MTREEAAKILEYPVYKWSLDWDERGDGLSYCNAIQMAVDALRAQQDTNQPLTLEELREMDGEPVWVECIYPGDEDRSGWCLVDADGDVYNDRYSFYNYCYDETWLAYRRKPEEVQSCR